MHGSLEQYMSSEAAQGLFMGQGEFQVSVEKALEKLGQFSLPDPGFWVLKMVQAAVAAEAPEIRFTFLRRKVKVEFSNTQNWNAGAILQSLLSGSVSDKRCGRHFAAGLLGAAVGFSQKIGWSCGTQSVSVDKKGHRIDNNSNCPDTVIVEATRPRRSTVSPSTLTSPVRYLLVQTVHEYKALVDHCRVSPIPITIDGHSFTGSYQVSIDSLPRISGFDSENPTGRQVLLSQLPLNRRSGPPLAYPIDEQPLTPLQDEYSELPTLRMPAEGVTRGVLCVYSCLQRVSRLNFVMDGVLIQSEDLFTTREELQPLEKLLGSGDEKFILDLYLGISEKKLDLSGFRVREKKFPGLLNECSCALLVGLGFLRRNIHLNWNFSASPTTKAMPWVQSLTDLAGTAFLALFIPHFLVVGGMVGAAYLVGKPIYSLLKVTPLGDAWQRRKERAREAEARDLLQEIDRMTRRLETFIEPS